MDVGGIALRDIIVVLAGVAGIYLVVMTLRLVQVGRHKRAAMADDFVAPQLAPELPDEFEAVPAAPVAVAPVLTAVPGGFEAELQRSQQEQEARQLREEVAQLRDELDLLRGELANLKAARNVSPQYADAIALAQRGLTAQDVADRCGISLGEAELVWALSRGTTDFDQEDDHGFDSGRSYARSA